MSKYQPLEEYRTQKFTTPPSARTVRKWCENGDIPAKKIRASWFVIVDDEAMQTGNKKVDSLINNVLNG
jgi:hypothetical protein